MSEMASKKTEYTSAIANRRQVNHATDVQTQNNFYSRLTQRYNKSAESAIQQIKDKNYPDCLKDYSGEVLLVGISYDDEKRHCCRIEKIVCQN